MPAYLFQISPDLRNLFPPQVREKYREWTAEEGVAESERSLYDSPGLRNIFVKIVNTTGQAVAGLHDLGQLIPMLRQLGTRHVGYGVQEEHLPAMGKALILSLRACLGDSFTDEVEYAWTTAFGFISAILVEAMRAHQPAMSLLHLVNEGKEGKSVCSSCSMTEPNEEVAPDEAPNDEVMVGQTPKTVVPEEQAMHKLAGA